MAVAYVDSSFGLSDDSGSVVLSGSDLLIVSALMEDDVAVSAPSGVVWNASEALAAISGAVTSGTTGDSIRMYGRVAPTATTAEVTATGLFNATGNIGAGFSGVNQTSLAAAVGDIVVAESASATSRSANVANMTADDLAFCVIAMSGANTGWSPDGTTREDHNTGGWSFMLVTKAGTGTVAIGGSGWSATRCSIVAGRIVAAGGGGGPSVGPVPGIAQRNRRHSGRYM